MKQNGLGFFLYPAFIIYCTNIYANKLHSTSVSLVHFQGPAGPPGFPGTPGDPGAKGEKVSAMITLSIMHYKA